MSTVAFSPLRTSHTGKLKSGALLIALGGFAWLSIGVAWVTALDGADLATAVLALVTLLGGVLFVAPTSNRAEQTIDVKLDAELCLEALKIELGTDTSRPTRNGFRAQISTSTVSLVQLMPAMTMYQELVEVSVEPTSATTSQIRVVSTSANTKTMIDFGRNRANVETFVQRCCAAVFQAERTAAARQHRDLRVLETRLARLQAQSESHFLYNALANVRALISRDAGRAVALLDALGTYLESEATSLTAIDSTLAGEFSLIRGYLEVMSIRMGERLTVELDLAPELEATPCLSGVLLPLVENAVKHGLEPAKHGGLIRVGASLCGPVLQLIVADTGVGFRQVGGSGTGLANLRARLLEWYGPAAGLQVREAPPQGVVVTLELPRTTS